MTLQSLKEFAAAINAENVCKNTIAIVGDWTTDPSHFVLRMRLLFPERTDGFYNSAPSNNEVRKRYWVAKKRNGGFMPFDLKSVLTSEE